MKRVGALLLAAGYGSRLRPLTDSLPKCLMPIRGRPLLEYWISILQDLDASPIIVNTHYREQDVKRFIEKKSYRPPVITSSEKNLLGTAGALRENSGMLRDRTTFLAHADNWSQCYWKDFLEFHHRQRPDNTVMTMMTFRTDSPSLCGIVEIDNCGRVLNLFEKVDNPPSNLANAAVYLIEKEIYDFLERNPEVSDFSTQVLPAFFGKIATWENRWIHRDIGSVGSLVKAQAEEGWSVKLPKADAWQTDFEKHPVHDLIHKLVEMESLDEGQ